MKNTPQTRGDRGTVELVELLEFAIEQANDGIAIMKFTGQPDIPIRIVYANETIERLSGFSREELLDPSSPFLKIQPQNRALYEALFIDVRAGKPVQFEIELGGKNRSTWTEIRWSPLRYGGGEVTHYVAVLRDISQRRQAQAERELLYRAVEQARGAVSIFEFPEGDPKRRYLAYANDALCELMKVPRERLMAEGIAGNLCEEDPALIDRCIAEVSCGATFVHEQLIRRGDGERRWIQVALSRFSGEPGRAERISVTYLDIDDRKRSEERLASFQSSLSQSPDFIVLTDAKRPSEGGPKVTYANPAFSTFVGLDSEQVVGGTLVDFLSPGNDAKTITGIVSQLERHQGISQELLLRRRDDGSDLWIELTGYHLRDSRGRAISWFFIGKDINARKQGYSQTPRLMGAIALADEPIVIYDVVKPLEFQMRHANERAKALDGLLLEKLLQDPRQRERIESAWPALQSGRSVSRLLRVAPSDPRRWVTLELRPITVGNGLPSSIVAIEHAVKLPHDEQSDDIDTVLALSREILRYDDVDSRRDAFLEVLRREWDATGFFSRARHDADLVIRAKDLNGYAVLPRGVLFERSIAVDFSWSVSIPPRRLTALRIFMETLARSD